MPCSSGRSRWMIEVGRRKLVSFVPLNPDTGRPSLETLLRSHADATNFPSNCLASTGNTTVDNQKSMTRILRLKNGNTIVVRCTKSSKLTLDRVRIIFGTRSEGTSFNHLWYSDSHVDNRWSLWNVSNNCLSFSPLL